MATDTGPIHHGLTRDEARLFTLLQDWHRWAAQFAQAPSPVRCRSCEKLLGAIVEPDGVRLRWLAEPAPRRHAYRLPQLRVVDRQTDLRWQAEGRRFNYVRRGRIDGNPGLPFRLGLPCALICPHCQHTTAVALPEYRRLNELRKMARRVLAMSAGRVERAYLDWVVRVGGRALSLRELDPPWPYADPEMMHGWVEDDDASTGQVIEPDELTRHQQARLDRGSPSDL